MAKVSVLLPVYNTDPAHLREAVESILNQTFQDFELLIIDDGSRDATLIDVIVTYKDKRIQYVRNERNAGIASVRNRLIDMAAGEYLAVMDHDDICAPQRLEKQVDFMDRYPEIGVCSCAYKRFGRLFKNRVITYPAGHDDIRVALFFKNVVHHPGAMMRKKTLDTHGIRYDETMVSVNDRKLFMDVGRVSRLANLPDVLCYYRLHSGMTSVQKRQQINEEQMRFRKSILDAMGVHLDDKQLHILNRYILNGRARVKNKDIVRQIEQVLSLLSEQNRKSGYFPQDAFTDMCALYLVKRCNNALLRSGVLSGDILGKTVLPVKRMKQPVILKLFNALLTRS